MKAVELKHVDEKYINRYFRNRSIFKTYKKYLLRCGMIALIIFTVWLAGALIGLFGSGYLLFSVIADGDTDLLVIGIIACLFFLLLTAGAVVMLLIISRDARKPAEHWVDVTAKNCGYSVSDILEFEKQAMESASLLVPTAVMLARTFKNGFLTRDYICFMDLQNMLKVMKCQDITDTCLYVSSAPILGTYKKTYDMYFELASKNNHFITTSLSGNVGKALQEVLKERYPQIEINAEKVLSEKEHGKWLDQLKERNKATS